MTKKELRQGLKALGNTRDEGSEALLSHILASPMYSQSKTILSFYGVAPEPDTLPFLKRALADGKRLCLPLTYGGGVMDAREIRSEADLVMGRYNIPEPKEGLPLVLREDIDLILTPGLGFDREGYRVGHGAGYYDRYLRGYEGITIGLCFQSRLVSKVPRDEFDMPVAYIVTEAGLTKCSG